MGKKLELFGVDHLKVPEAKRAKRQPQTGSMLGWEATKRPRNNWALVCWPTGSSVMSEIHPMPIHQDLLLTLISTGSSKLQLPQKSPKPALTGNWKGVTRYKIRGRLPSPISHSQTLSSQIKGGSTHSTKAPYVPRARRRKTARQATCTIGWGNPPQRKSSLRIQEISFIVLVAETRGFVSDVLRPFSNISENETGGAK